MPSRRSYRLGARAEAAERTRTTILDAAVEAFQGAWYDEVTLADVARRAGVSQQTVVNHFGSKEDLYLTGLRERVVPQIEATRARVRVGEVASVVNAVLDEYEGSGLETLRLLALADRQPTLAEIARGGRAFHRSWLADALAPQLDRCDQTDRSRIVGLLATVLDVRTWHQLRVEEGRSRRQVEQDLRRLVDAVLSGSTGETGTSAGQRS